VGLGSQGGTIRQSHKYSSVRLRRFISVRCLLIGPALLLGLLLGERTLVSAGEGLASSQSNPTDRTVTYESVATGLLRSRTFATEILPGVGVEIQDLILGPGKSAGDIPSPGVEVLELKSGEVETTIGGQTIRRRPGNYWVVRPGERYSLKSLGGMAVLHAVIFGPK
jgi:quercetin dioxygenase-like cupin family protein